MTWTIDIRNIAGIYNGSAEIQSGINAVAGSNWQGKSSFIQAIETAIGVKRPLTEGENQGKVQISMPDQTVNVELVRSEDSISVRGNTLLDKQYERICAELFACLGEDNDVRATVRRNEPLDEVLLKPLDFQDIEHQINQLKRERDRLDDEISQAQEAKKRLPSLNRQLNEIKSEIAKLEEKKTSIPASADTESAIQEQLSQAQAKKSKLESQIERLSQSVEQISSSIEEKQSELDKIAFDGSAEALQSELQNLRKEKQNIEQSIDILQNIHSANQMALEEDHLDLITEVDRQLTDDTVICWSCGSEVSRSDVQKRVRQLGEKISSKQSNLQEYQQQIDEIEEKYNEFKQARRRKKSIKEDINRLKEQKADRQQRLDQTQQQLEEVITEIEELQAQVDANINEITDLRSELKYRRTELEDIQSKHNQLQERANQEEQLTSQRESIQEEIVKLRDQKDRTKRRIRESFNKAIKDISTQLNTGFDSAYLTGNFELVIARDGRETQLEALSEGEIELIGIIAAIAGHEAYDVDEVIPFMLLDGIGDLAVDNLGDLIAYLRDRVNYLIFTRYPEQSMDEPHIIDPIQWDVTSRA